MNKPVYKIKTTEVKDKPAYYEVVRPCGHVINGVRHSSYREAEKRLVLLEAMGYCKRG